MGPCVPHLLPGWAKPGLTSGVGGELPHAKNASRLGKDWTLITCSRCQTLCAGWAPHCAVRGRSCSLGTLCSSTSIACLGGSSLALWLLGTQPLRSTSRTACQGSPHVDVVAAMGHAPPMLLQPFASTMCIYTSAFSGAACGDLPLLLVGITMILSPVLALLHPAACPSPSTHQHRGCSPFTSD